MEEKPASKTDGIWQRCARDHLVNGFAGREKQGGNVLCVEQ